MPKKGTKGAMVTSKTIAGEAPEETPVSLQSGQDVINQRYDEKVAAREATVKAMAALHEESKEG